MENKPKTKAKDQKSKTRKKPNFKAQTEAKKKVAKEKGVKIDPVSLDTVALPEKKPVGRPSKFEEAAPKIIAYIRKGNTYECAAGCARVTYYTFNNWMNQGREDEKLENYDSKYFQFFKDVEEAERTCEEEVLGYWKQEMPGNWQAARDFLARRHHASWGSKDKVDVTSNGETVGKPYFLPMKDEEDE